MLKRYANSYGLKYVIVWGGGDNRLYCDNLREARRYAKSVHGEVFKNKEFCPLKHFSNGNK